MAVILHCWKCALVGVGPKGEAIVNTFHYGLDTLEGPVDPYVFATAFQTMVSMQFPPLVTSDWLDYSYSATSVKGTNLGLSATLGSLITNGLLAPPSSAVVDCAIMRRQATYPGRKGRGRMFISPLPEASFDVDGKFTPPIGWEAAAEALAMAPLTVGVNTYVACLFNKTTVTAEQITHAQSSPLMGVMRRRRLRLPN